MTTNEETRDAILDHMAEHGAPPSVRELGKRLGLSSPSSVHERIKACEAAGLIERVGTRKFIIVKEEV